MCNRYIFIFLFCVFFAPSIARASVTIAFRTAKEVVIGTDSLAASNKGDILPIRMCKIIQARKIFLAFTGRPIIPVFKFDAFALAKDIFSREDTIRNKIELYDAIISWKLRQIVDRVKEDRQYTKDWYEDSKGMLLTVIISEVTNNYPVIYVRGYQIINEQPVIIDANPAELTYPLSNIGINDVIVGAAKEINRQRGTDILSLDSPNFSPIKAIRDWIKLEAIANPQKVALPIDILRITPGKAEWIQHKPECPEIDQSFFDQHPN